MKNKCPKCESENIEQLEYRGTKVIVCKECDYDGREELDVTPEERSTQREKARFSPYRTGGSKRTR